MYPEPKEPKAIFCCDSCNNDLYEGDEYIEYDGDIICRDCLEDFTTRDWLRLIDIDYVTVSKDKEY